MSHLIHRSLRSDPPLALSGQGIHLRDQDGRAIIDGSGGAAVACLGHGHPRVLEAMRADIPTIAAGVSLEVALQLLQTSGAPAVGVTGANGQLIGLVTPENVGELMMVLAARPERPAGAPRPPAGGRASPWG